MRKERRKDVRALIEDVDSHLLWGYEQKHLGGRCLENFVLEKEVLARKISGAERKRGLLLVGWLVTALLLPACSILGPLSNRQVFVIVLAVAVYMGVFGLLRWKEGKWMKLHDYNERVLETFSKAVEELNPLGLETITSYSEAYVRNLLFVLADKLRQAEGRLREDRLSPHVLVPELVETARHEMHCRKLFDRTLEVAENFGLALKRTEFFPKS